MKFSFIIYVKIKSYHVEAVCYLHVLTSTPLAPLSVYHRPKMFYLKALNWKIKPLNWKGKLSKNLFIKCVYCVKYHLKEVVIN